MQGAIKWFDDKKGYGFILGDDGIETFVHHTDLPGSGRKSPEEGQRVEYEIKPTERGMRAVNVIRARNLPDDREPFQKKLERAITDWETETRQDRNLHRVQDFMMWFDGKF